MPNINFELKKEDLKLKLDGNINNIALKELRKIINSAKNNQNAASSDNGENKEDDNEFYDISYRFSKISRRLRKNKEFRKLIIRFYDEYGDYYTESIRLNNILEFTTKNKKIDKEFKLNEIELKKQLKTIFNNINKNHVDFLIIHIGGINIEEIEIAVDLITKEIFNIPKKTIKSKYKSNKALVELIFFGNNIKKNRFSSCNDDDF
ncbi:hypothetical protein HYV80_05995 [Candidatus Woesearchaeota archaeon]|nr:hypothetical protein [Candidatus Woesearchaeota archaeon]